MAAARWRERLFNILGECEKLGNEYQCLLTNSDTDL